MFKKLNPHCYSIVCAHCGERGTAEIYSGLGMSAEARQAVACRDLLDQGWSSILMPFSYCPECSGKLQRSELVDKNDKICEGVLTSTFDKV